MHGEPGEGLDDGDAKLVIDDAEDASKQNVAVPQDEENVYLTTAYPLLSFVTLIYLFLAHTLLVIVTPIFLRFKKISTEFYSSHNYLLLIFHY